MCDWGACQPITIEQHILVDACLAELIVAMNRLGIRTTGSCCGHGKGPGSVQITPSSVGVARACGFTVETRGDAYPEVVLPACGLSPDEPSVAAADPPLRLRGPAE